MIDRHEEGAQPHVVVRHARPDDERRIAAMLTRCSPTSLHKRFLTPVPVPGTEDGVVPHERARELSEVRHPRDLVLVALHGDEVVAVAELRLRTATPHHADVALLVDDDHQRTGIGSLLVRQLTAAAEERRIDQLCGDTFADNELMIRLFQRAGLHPHATTGAGVTQVQVPLDRLPKLRNGASSCAG